MTVAIAICVAVALVLAGCPWVASGSRHGSPEARASARPRPTGSAPAPSPSPDASASVAADTASPLPNRPSTRPFAFTTSPDGLLFYFDPVAAEIVPIPGAGASIANAYFFDDFRRISFDQGGRLWAYDLDREQKILFSGTEDLGPVFAPDLDGDLLLFHSATDVFLWQRGGWPGPWPEASPSASIAPSDTATPSVASGPPVALAPFRTVGALHGGILDARSDDPGDVVAAIAGHGTLWVYWRLSGILRLVADLRSIAGGRVQTLDIDETGRLIVVSIGESMVMIDVLTGLIDPLPYPNRAFNAVAAHSPTWITAEEFYYLAQDSAGRSRILLYNRRNESIRSLALVNHVAGSGRQAVSAGP